MSTLSFPAAIVKPNTARYGIRAPKGGCTVAGKVFRGGQFCFPFDPANPHGRPVVEAAPAPAKLAIAGFTYAAREIPAGECGTVAFALQKVDTGHHYDVIRNHFGEVTCDCPDYIWRHQDHGTMCKHGRALVAAGMMPAPAPAAPDGPEPEAPFDGRAMYAWARDHRCVEVVAAFGRARGFGGYIKSWSVAQATRAYHEAVGAVEGGVL